MTLNEHVFGLHIVVANDEWFSSLSPEHQQIVADGARVLAAVENVEKTTGDWAAIEEIRSMAVETAEAAVYPQQ